MDVRRFIALVPQEIAVHCRSDHGEEGCAAAARGVQRVSQAKSSGASIHADWLRGCSSGMLRSPKLYGEVARDGQWPQPSLHAAWLRVNATLGSYSVLFVGTAPV